MRKILFLDIDGVLNSYRSVMAYDNYPKDNDSTDKFDMVAVGMIRTACRKCKAEIVLSSTWRKFKGWEQLAETLGLPIITRTSVTLSSRKRGEEIQQWLDENPNVHYVIVDDDSDMLDSQKKFFVHVNEKEGLSYENYCKIIEILGEDDA